MIRAGRTTPRALAFAILAAALLLRIVVPQGWMPVDTGQGWRIVICTGSGPVQMTAGMKMTGGMHHLPGGPDHGAGDHACPYGSLALALAMAEPILPVVALPAIMRSVRLVAAVHTVAVGRGLAAPPPPATGPPLV